jgi:hypothetical protein
VKNYFDEYLNPGEIELMNRLVNPTKIQSFLDSIPYSAEDKNRCPVQVLNDLKAHCLDGALFGAAALRRLGYPPLLVDLLPEPGTDDDHVLAIYKKNGYFGALAKSNYVGLRFREPIYLSLRELVASYFEQFFNIFAQKTLRYYTMPINMAKFDHLEWMWKDENLEIIEHYFLKVKRFPILHPELVDGLSLVDQRSFKAGMIGSNPEGLFQPRQ